jgi:hypothetical protein
VSDSWDENDIWKAEEPEEEEVRPRPASRRRRAPRNEKQGNLYLLTGLVIGIVLGLVYAWLISPLRYVDTAPSSLAEPYKDQYRLVIAQSYAANHDLARARERLTLIQAGSPVQILAAQAQRLLDQSPQEARVLALLAADLGRGAASVPAENAPGETPSAPAVAEVTAATPEESPITAPSATTNAASTNTPEIPSAIQTPTVLAPTHTPTVTQTALPTFTPRPTTTPVLALEAPFLLKNKREVCDTSIQPGQIQIEVAGLDGNPLAGVKILITWQNGEDEFFTGLAPEVSPGYADFTMTTGITYFIKVGEASKAMGGIAMPSCGGGWKMTFEEGKQ